MMATWKLSMEVFSGYWRYDGSLATGITMVILTENGVGFLQNGVTMVSFAARITTLVLTSTAVVFFIMALRWL
jgi:hypothetical protein